MKAILDNPYRITGLLAGASAKEQEKQIRLLKMYIGAGLDLPKNNDYSFPMLGELTRAIDSINEAESKLGFDRDKMEAALFWFWKENEITDRAAFDSLKEGDTDTAYQIWDNLINYYSWEIVTEENYSAFHNYFVLEMLRENGNMTEAITRNLCFLENDLSQKFVLSIIGSFFKITAKELQINFLNVILYEIDQKTVKLTLEALIKILNNANFIAKEEFLKSISQKIVSKINTEIETCRKKRTTSSVNTAGAGETLYRKTITDLAQLKSIAEAQDFSYSNIADKAANEILQCSIDFFNDSQEKELENDYYEKTEALINYAKQIAIGFSAIDKIEENTRILAEMKLKYKLSEAQPYIDKILALLNDPMLINLESKFSRSYSSGKMIAKAKEIITLAQPDLLCIKTLLKENNDRYLGISTRVANDAQQLITVGVNQVQEKLDTSSLKEIIKNAWEAIELIDTLDMHSGFFSQYQNDIKAVKNRLEKLEIVSKEAEEKLKESNNQYKKNIRAIQNNPYRILGLLAGSTVSEINRHIDLLKAGQKLDVDYSFSCLGRFERILAGIDEAAVKLNLDADKMNASLFWFWNGDPLTDGVAFSALNYGDKKKAMDIWTERTYEKEVTESNISAFQNFSTLLLLLNDYEHGIKLKLNLLESDFITEFITAVTGRTDTVTPKELKSSFLNVLRNELGLKNDIIADIELSSKQDLLKIKSQKITNNLTSNIDKAKNERTKNKENAAQAGEMLFKNTKGAFEKLKSMVGIQNIIYTDIAGVLANEILNCANDYFNFWKIMKLVDLDFFVKTSNLIKLAQKISVGAIVISKINESGKIFNRHIDIHADEIKNEIKNIENEIKQIENEIKALEDKSKTISNTVFYDTEIRTAKKEMEKIKSFHLFRSHSTREDEIIKQQHFIIELEKKSKKEKQKQIVKINNNILGLKLRIEEKKQQRVDLQTIINNLKIIIHNA